MKTMNSLKRMIMCCVMFVCASILFAQTYQATHEVKRGETIESIAKQYGVTEQMIKDANPQVGNLFYVGLKLNIPKRVKTNDAVSTKEPIPDSTETEQVIVNGGGSNQNHALYNGMSYDVEGTDNFFAYQPDAKIYGLGFDMDISKYVFGGMAIYSNLKFKPDKALSFQINFNLGVKKRVLVNERFMLVGKLYPYIGWYGAPYSDDTEFTYGAQAMVGAGIKLFDTPKGKSVFLTGGYNIVAGEFKTKGMFDYGYWMLGITFVTK